ncbi:MAG: hypothetical protein E7321_07005 [Clostridiales bacterium]|nr:hypothetical protein [Clostridiales bacterium]
MEAIKRYVDKNGGITLKKIVFVLCLTALLAVSTLALGELGFAEVIKNNVNMRRAPGGKTIMQLDAPRSVFVFEEKRDGEYLWCHVNTFRGKDTVDGWIRGDMLRFVSDEFTDIVQVQAGDHYATGVRSDGTVAILGDDMPHAPCVDTVRTWRNIDKIASSTCAVYALKRDKSLITVGRSSQYGIWQAADISGEQPVLLDQDGYILPESWADSGNREFYFPQEARGMRFVEAAPVERHVKGGLTREGKVVWFEGNKGLESAFANGPYTDIDMYFYHLAALREDGRVDAAIRLDVYKQEAPHSACDVGYWENVVQVATGVRHTLGLKADGTVYYAGDDARHRAQVESWTDVAQIDAGNGYSIALKKDGSVVMAGAYTSYDR